MVQEAADSRLGHYRCLGIGVGPANLSLASLMHGHPEITNLFLDKKERFGWHDGQQLPDTTIQVSMLKDLVSLSEPTNSYSFLSYLHELGRIYHFLNARFDNVPRQEFRNYMEWACQKNENVVFGEEVLEVDFTGSFVVRTNARTITADNVVVGVGILPYVPDCARPHLGDRQFHMADFMTRATNLGGLRVGVVGGGQSGAEAFLDLISRSAAELPRRVAWISRRPNYLPIDDSPFTNDLYMPCYSDYFAQLDAGTRRTLNRRNILTSDGVSETTLKQIYQRLYTHRFINGYEDLVALYPNRGVASLTGASPASWNVFLTHNDHPDQPEQIELDVIIWATGYRQAPMDFLAPIKTRLEREDDEYKIDDDYSIKWDGPADRNIFLQNATRGQRGLADPNLSLNAWRSQRILDRLRGVRSGSQLNSFIEWTTKPSNGELRGA